MTKRPFVSISERIYRLKLCVGVNERNNKMSIGKTVWSVKCGVIGMLLVMEMTSVAEPTVTVGEVTTGEPWSKVTVNYTLGGTDAKLEYKVAFTVTAGGLTASVTNDAAKLTDGAATQVIDTVALFGKQVSDTKAKVRVSLIAVKPKGVQLWENGPFWAECNVGATKPEEYGAYYKFDDADSAVKSLLGQMWRVPSKDDFDKLADSSYCTQEWDSDKKGYRFTGKGDYSSDSIFLPAAGYFNDQKVSSSVGVLGVYWSSMEKDSASAWDFSFVRDSVNGCNNSTPRRYALSVRAVR